MILSKTAISPFTPKKVGSAFNPSSETLHFWDFNNLTDVGSTITIPDTGTVGGLNMTNPDASSKPTVVGDYLQFQTDDVIRALVANFRSGDSSGEFISHVRLDAGTQIYDLATWDSGNVQGYINQSSISSNTYRFIHSIPPNARSQRGSTNISSGWFTVTSGCTGSAYYIIISGNNETLTAISGANDGSVWLSDQSSNDSIAIGGRLSLLPNYADISWKCGGYTAYSSIAESIELNQKIHNYCS